MALETGIMGGVFEDHTGQALYPKTTANLVACEDGETVEHKLQGIITLGETMTATMASGVQRMTVDLTSKIRNLSSTAYFVQILSSTADGESPVAIISHELIGGYLALMRQGVTVTKAIQISYRIVSMSVYTQPET